MFSVLEQTERERTDEMRKTIAAIGIALGIMSAAIGTASAIEEDDPGWDCHTMGNMICGPDQGEPEDSTVCFWDGSQWLSAYSQTYGEVCRFGA